MRRLQSALLAQNAYIAPLYDVKPDDPDFALLQRIAATGILRMTGEPFQWANRTWFYPERGLSVGEFSRGLHDYAPQVGGVGRSHAPHRGIGCRNAPQGRRCRRCRRYGAPDAA